MRAGQLDKSITIVKIKFGVGDGLSDTEIDADFIPMRAAIIEQVRGETLTSSERTSRPGIVSKWTITFRMRWIDGLDLRDKIEYAGERFDIRSITEIGRRRELDVAAVATGSTDWKVTN